MLISIKKGISWKRLHIGPCPSRDAGTVFNAFKSEPRQFTKEDWKEAMTLNPEDLEKTVTALRELGLNYDEVVKLMSGVTKDVESLRVIWGKPSAGGRKGSSLVKLGVSLIAFPVPTIGIKKSLGTMLIAAGLVQERIKHIHAADVYSTFQEVNKELQKFR